MEEQGSGDVDLDGLTPEVLEMIFCRLPVNDLLSSSVVSKNWKTAARDVLKRRRECYVYIKDFGKDIQDLNQAIASTNIMEMINGLHIRSEIKRQDQPGSVTSSSQQAFCSSNEAEEKWEESEEKWEEPADEWKDYEEMWKKIEEKWKEPAEKLKDYQEMRKKAEEKCKEAKEKRKQKVQEVLQVPWTYLNLYMGCAYKPDISEDDAKLLREVVSATSGSLERLVIGHERDWNFIPCDGNEYSKLKTIQLLNDQYLHNIRIRRKIFSQTCAPKLEEITGAMMKLEVSNPLDYFVIKRMKSVMLRSQMGVSRGKAKKRFGCISGLRQLDLQHYDCDPYEEDLDQQQEDLASWNAFVFPFVLRSLDTLEQLHMYTSDLYILFRTYEALKFPNLRRLSLATDLGVFPATEISILKQLNLARLCPKLEQVELAGEHSCFGAVEMDVIRPLEALEQSNLPVHIVLDCEQGNIEQQMVLCDHLTFFNTIYPNAVQVRILNWEEAFVFQMGSVIWDMNSLEYLEMNIQRRCVPTDKFPFGLDALLCGINVEEAKLLFGGRPNTTENSVVVPIRPSLFDAKSLKELKITEGIIGRGEMFKSSCVIQITENLPVRHERTLKVTFEGSKGWYNKLKQMRAFSTFRSAQVHEN